MVQLFDSIVPVNREHFSTHILKFLYYFALAYARVMRAADQTLVFGQI
jgi:hypothetical protein